MNRFNMESKVKCKVLVIDDDQSTLDILATLLEDLGYIVSLAASGEEALEVFKSVRPAIVLSDIFLPGINGIELLKRLKQINPEVEVIMITGHGDMDASIRSLKYDATDFLLKPISFSALEFALRKADEKIIMRRRLREYGANQAMYNVIINQLIQEDVIVIGGDYRILDVNDTFLKKVGLTRKEAIGRFCYEITHRRNEPCSGEDHPCPLMETLTTSKASKATHVHPDAEGNENYVSISCYPLFENGKATGAIEISKDISSEMNLQKVMMQQEKLASIGRLSAGVAHEINNPLTTILTTAMLLLEDIDEDHADRPELQTIVDETLRCRKIVTSLLDFARQSKPEKKQADISAIVSECITLTRKQAAFNDVVLEQQSAEDLPEIRVDKDQLQQAIINLILNAVEATSAGGKVSIATGLNPDKNVMEIHVSDTGQGISKGDIDRIFDPFFTSKENGTGLGLAITHGIIEQHEGQIQVTSKSGEGTHFTVSLPLKKSTPDEQ